LARVRTDAEAKAQKPSPRGAARPAATLGNNGAYDPSYLQSAYNAPSATGGSGQKVAIVDAFDDPNAEADLAAYRSTFGLAPCTTANGCFQKVDENGGTAYPAADSGWSQESSLDLDMVSALCPNCHILLVEARTAYIADLGTGVNTARSMGANAISNSYGSNEYNGEAADSTTYYNHPGTAVTVASGDGGYGAQFPAASQSVTAVGGTSLTQNTDVGTRNGTETAWGAAGSGCSAYIPKPSWQRDKGCSDRTVGDVSAVADPNTGVWMYDTYASSGWSILGGTSVAAPIIASFFALEASPPSSNQLASYPYEAPAVGLNDVISGSNGICGSYLCTAGAGYDGPTGLGTPNGTVAFGPPVATAPTAPQRLSATGGTDNANLLWSPPSSGASGVTYNIYRSTSPGTERSNNAAPIAKGVGGGSYTDNGLTSGIAYYYVVTATNSSGQEGPSSNEASATPTSCVTYTSASTGSHQVCGAILAKYQALGGPTGFLGYPTTNETSTPDGIGRFNHFANNGSIYWTPNAGAWSIRGAIRTKWASLGWERSFLGYPVTDETGTPDGIGRFNHFSNSGSIYWTPNTGAWSIHGLIRAKYLALGGPTSVVGYPVTDETGTPDGIGRFNHFSNSGSIYWTPNTGAWSVHGAIRGKWASLGWERSCLGYPVSDEFGISGGRESNFQHGAITYSFSSGQAASSC
jgi:hypothetical protein